MIGIHVYIYLYLCYKHLSADEFVVPRKHLSCSAGIRGFCDEIVVGVLVGC